jgi:hypothetical protein
MDGGIAIEVEAPGEPTDRASVLEARAAELEAKEKKRTIARSARLPT